ncbi:hypothetical protein ACFY7C_19280 [Streptomyces sp. NPDC012769]|uniref:hypothetical protein n=1 Tax=Streptomyces sp. NPDC012769 TaxID=3364848 RepID=UPI0036BEFCBD
MRILDEWRYEWRRGSEARALAKAYKRLRQQLRSGEITPEEAASRAAELERKRQL